MKQDLSNPYERDYFLQKNQPLNSLVASDLQKITETIESKLSDCVILLGGSLAYGEGKYKKSGEELVICSDYDIFVIVPSLFKALRTLFSKQLKSLLSKLNLSNSLELVVVWEGALRLHFTTVAGNILAGRERGENIFNHLSVPEFANNLKRAFKYLLSGIAEPENQGRFFRRSITQAFQALLLSNAKKENLRYEVWKNFYSLRYALQVADNFKERLGDPTYKLLKKVLSEELTDEPPQQELGFEEFSIIRNCIVTLYLDSNPTLKTNDYIRYLTFNIKEGRLPNPLFNSTHHYFKAAYLLLMSVEGINRFNEEKLHASEMILAKLTGFKHKRESPAISFKNLVERLFHYDESYLHKVILTR